MRGERKKRGEEKEEGIPLLTVIGLERSVFYTGI